jgi:hypothetical protein
MEFVVWTAVVCTLGAGPPDVPAHSANAAYHAIVSEGVSVAGKKTTVPEPRLPDGRSADEQRAILKAIAGSDQAVEEFLRPSVTAPFVLRTSDESTAEGDLVRHARLWFAVQARLDSIDPAILAKRSGDGRPFEAGNMRFSLKTLNPAQLKAAGISSESAARGTSEWFVHMSGRLLDRIAVEETDQITASRSDESWIIASRPERRFDQDKEFPNQWSAIGDRDGAGETKRYAGGAGYVKITRLAIKPETLFVEAQFYFVEPRAWFDGAPILRSKIGLVAQDRIRALRRELAKSRGQAASERRSAFR